VFRIQSAQPWFGGRLFGTFDLFHQRAPQVRWERRHATVFPQLSKLHRAQRTNVSLKPHKLVRKMSPDSAPVNSFAAQTPFDPRPRENDQATADNPPVNREPDEVQVAPPSNIEHKPEQIIDTAPVDAWTDVVQPVIEHRGARTTRSLDALSVAMVMLLLTLGATEFLFRPTYAKRLLAFGWIRRSKPDGARAVNLSSGSRDQLETDPNGASSLESSVRKVLDTIREVETEMAASRQHRAPLQPIHSNDDDLLSDVRLTKIA
jgi:hypothetical protein